MSKYSTDELVEKAQKYNAYSPYLFERLKEVEIFFIGEIHEESGKLSIQEFLTADKKPYIPIFASEASFLAATKGSPWVGRGLKAKILHIAQHLKDEDIVVINPHTEHSFVNSAKLYKQLYFGC